MCALTRSTTISFGIIPEKSRTRSLKTKCIVTTMPSCKCNSQHYENILRIEMW
jgi:hypothetical protein